MSWYNVDDMSAFHPKVVEAGNAAWGALTRMGAHSKLHRTGGVVPRAIAKSIATKTELLRLLSVGFLHERADGAFEIHDFHEWNQTEAEVDERMAKVAEKRRLAGRKGAAARWQSAISGDGNCHAFAIDPEPFAIGKPMANEWQTDGPNPKVKEIPTSARSAHGSPPILVSGGERLETPSKGSRGSRIPEDFYPNPSVIDRFRTRERVDPLECLEVFVNYWSAKAGKDATKVDWQKTFVNWVLRDYQAGKLATLPAVRALPPPSDEPPREVVSPEVMRQKARELEVLLQTAFVDKIV